VQALSNKSYVFLQKRVLDQTILYAKKALRIDPNFGSAHFNLGMAYFYQKQYPAATTELKLALRSFPDNPEVYERIGDAYRAQTRNEEALAYYRQAIQVDPLDTTARDKLGDVYADMDEEKKAIEQYKASTDLNPENIEAHYKMADHYEGVRDWPNARKEYLLILATDPEQAKAHKQVALIYERDDEMGMALYHWDKYLDIVPNDSEAKQHMIDIRKPMLTKKQAEEMAAYNKKIQNNYYTPEPTAAPDSQTASGNAPQANTP